MSEHSDQQQRIDEEVRRTLVSLHELGDIEPGPYFEARVMQRISAGADTSASPTGWQFGVFRPATAVLTAMVVLNLLTAWWVLPINPAPVQNAIPLGVEALASDYSLNSGWLDFGSAEFHPVPE